MPTNETIRRLRNKDNTGPDMKDFDSGNIGPVAPNHPDAGKYGAYLKGRETQKNQTKSKGKGSSGKTKDAVKGVIDGASKVLSTLQAANAKAQRGLGNLNKTGYDNIRDPGTVKGQSALANDADDKEYQQAKAKIEKEDKKNGYA